LMIRKHSIETKSLYYIKIDREAHHNPAKGRDSL
jgi:hypothetical protein